MSRFIRCSKDEEEEVLLHWQGIFEREKAAQSEERALFKHREQLYRGIKDEDAPTYEAPEGEKYAHTYNIIYENIEAQVDSSIYPVKVTALHPNNEKKAKKIERRLNSIAQRAAFKGEVDLSERTVRIQGGTYWFGEWDNEVRTHTTSGDVCAKEWHPQNVIPQHGALSIEDMRHIFIEFGMTKADVESTYGIKLHEEGEDEPEARSVVGDAVPAEDFVTVRIGYFRHESGSIGKVAWAGNTLLCYMEDCEAKSLFHCEKCGNTLSTEAFEGDEEEKTVGFLAKILGKGKQKKQPVCPVCGGNKWEEKTVEEETIQDDIVFPGAVPDASGNYAPGDVIPAGTVIPVYKPGVLPFVLQKSVSAENELLGISDVDVMEDQQELINLISRKMHERIDAARPFISLPDDLTIEPGDGVNYIRPSDPAKADMVKVVDVRLDLTPFQYARQIPYEEARNLIGITDSFQGRYDSSAKSGVAKQASAAQAAGRLQSKREMKAAALAEFYELWFKLILAYDDDIRDVVYRGDDGKMTHESFWRYEFLEKDEDGNWYWNDEYIFECDMSLALMQDRTELWHQAAQDYSAGLYGQVGSMDALIMLWKHRDFLHYPLAGETLKALEAQKKALEEAQRAAQNAALNPGGNFPPIA